MTLQLFGSEYMRDLIFELRRKRWRHHRSYTHNLGRCEIKAWKNSSLNDTLSTSRSITAFWLVKSLFVTFVTNSSCTVHTFVQLKKINWFSTLHELFSGKLWEPNDFFFFNFSFFIFLFLWDFLNHYLRKNKHCL